MEQQVKEESLAAENVENIQRWLQTEAQFRGQTDERFIKTFLIACEHDVEKTKDKITNYYTLKKLYPMLMTNQDISEEKNMKLFNLCVATSDFAQSEREFPVVVVNKYSRATDGYDLFEGTCLLLTTFQSMILESKRLQNRGIICILDFEGISYSLLYQFTSNYFLQAFRCVTEGLPCHIHQIHIINAGMIISTVINVSRLVLPTNVNDILYVHNGSWDCLNEHVPLECLPEEYGGTNGTVMENHESGREIIFKWRDLLMSNNDYGFDDDEDEDESESA